MTRGHLLPLLISTALLVPTLALGQQADDPWGGLRANGERPAPAARPAAPQARPVAPAAPAAATTASPATTAASPPRPAPATAAAPAAAAPAPATPAAAPVARTAAPAPATPAVAPATAAAPRPAAPTVATPLPRPRPAEAPAREVAVAAPAAETLASAPSDGAVAAAPDGEASLPETADDRPSAPSDTPALASTPVDPIAAAAARSEGAPPARMPSFPGDRPFAATAYGIMAAFAPISEAAAAVPPVSPADVAPPAALPRTEARVIDAVPAGPRPGTPAIPVAPAPVVMPTAAPAAASVPVAAPVTPAPRVSPPPAAVEAAPVPAMQKPTAPAAVVAIPTAPAQVEPPAPAAPVQMALANPSSVISGPASGPPPLGKVEPSPGSARAPLWPQDLVRALRRAQDSMAQGSTPALDAQRTLIARIEQEFAAADANTWQDPHNARAAVTYFLSGGNPAILRRMMDMQPPPAIDPRLLRGTLAYLEGREDESLRQLKDIDARSLPPSLGGQVALAQAALNVRKDPAKSAQLLAVARLLAPGTLVEEAALRRAILIASQLGDAAQFEYLSKQYLFRFRNSVYAGNFRQRFAAALSRIGFGNDPAQFHRLDAMLDMLEPDSRREMELTVARAAVVQGLTTTANFAADRALAALPDGSDEAERARLYRGASMAANPNTYKEALTDLGAVSKDRLAPSDAALLAAASATAETVRRATEMQPALAPKAAQAVGPLTKDEMLPVMDRARAAINNADAVLKGTAR